MTDIRFPNSATLLESVLNAVRDLGGRATNKEIHDKVAKDLQLTAEQVSKIHSGKRTELEYRLAWARTNAKRKGLLIATEDKHWALP